MKYPFLALLLLISMMSSAQDSFNHSTEDKPENIIKKANTIIINNELAQAELFGKISDQLFENGYGILNADVENGNITTSEKAFKNGSIKLSLLIKDKRVLIRGNFKSDMTFAMYGVTAGNEWIEICYRGQKKSPAMLAWDEMAKIADAIPGNKEYLIK